MTREFNAIIGSMNTKKFPSAALLLLLAVFNRFGPEISRHPSGYLHAVLKSPMGGEVAAAYAVMPSAGGGLVLAGVASDRGGVVHSCLWRLHSDGRPDLSFAPDGAACSREEEWAWGASPGLDGRFYYGGIIGKDWKKSPAAFVRCRLSSGAPCPEFGQQGRVLLKAHGGHRGAAVFAVAAASSSVFAAGNVTGPDGAARAAVWELDLRGRPASSLVNGGAEALESPAGSRESRVQALLPLQGGLVAGGNSDWKRSSFWEFRRGRVGGRSMTGPPGVVRAMAVGGDGAVYAAGFRYGAAAGEKAETGQIFKIPVGEVEHLDSMENQEVFSLVRLAGRLYAGGYADEKGKVKAAIWRAGPQHRSSRSFGLAPIKILPDVLGGGESRVYSITASGGAIAAAGYSKDPEGGMSASVWLVPPF